MPDEHDGIQVTDLGAIPATEIRPEDVGTLSVRYVDAVPVLTISGGAADPAALTVQDASGNPVGIYTAGPLDVAPTARIGMAAVRPAEFIVLEFTQEVGQA
ncbi:hypothetical protein [Streptomyces sp. NBC_00212]|uniref:hypothetical protein n=1 Tax=Streptomyces sp. NBC_00212 TaxID=2975684 RepID=UPI0032459701